MLYWYLIFQLTNEINLFTETNYGDHNFIHIKKQTKRVTQQVEVGYIWLMRGCCKIFCFAVTADQIFAFLMKTQPS